MKTENGETLSGKLDRKVQEIKEEKDRINTMVTAQYEEAKKVIGERFTMKKDEAKDLLFNFFFTGLYDCYDCSLRSEVADITAEFSFEHNIRGDEGFLEPREIVSLPHKILLTSLTYLLVKWSELLVDYELRKEESK